MILLLQNLKCATSWIKNILILASTLVYTWHWHVCCFFMCLTFKICVKTNSLVWLLDRLYLMILHCGNFWLTGSVLMMCLSEHLICCPAVLFYHQRFLYPHVRTLNNLWLWERSFTLKSFALNHISCFSFSFTGSPWINLFNAAASFSLDFPTFSKPSILQSSAFSVSLTGLFGTETSASLTVCYPVDTFTESMTVVIFFLHVPSSPLLDLAFEPCVLDFLKLLYKNLKKVANN